MTEEQTHALWLSLPSVSDDGLDRLGIDRRIANRAGGLAWAHITTAGRGFDFDPTGIPTIIQGVWRGPAPSIECAVETPYPRRPDSLAPRRARSVVVQVGL